MCCAHTTPPHAPICISSSLQMRKNSSERVSNLLKDAQQVGSRAGIQIQVPLAPSLSAISWERQDQGHPPLLSLIRRVLRAVCSLLGPSLEWNATFRNPVS